MYNRFATYLCISLSTLITAQTFASPEQPKAQLNYHETSTLTLTNDSERVLAAINTYANEHPVVRNQDTQVKGRFVKLLSITPLKAAASNRSLRRFNPTSALTANTQTTNQTKAEALFSFNGTLAKIIFMLDTTSADAYTVKSYSAE